MQLAIQEIETIIPVGADFILVDETQWGGGEILADRHCIPFLERDGEYWGLPSDDHSAVRELERLRQLGAKYIVFAQPAFWWLDYYSGLHAHLRSTYPQVFKSMRLKVFDIRVETVDSGSAISCSLDTRPDRCGGLHRCFRGHSPVGALQISLIVTWQPASQGRGQSKQTRKKPLAAALALLITATPCRYQPESSGTPSISLRSTMLASIA